MSKPIVSFIMSVFNGDHFLLQCIESINTQTYQDYEVIVVDDGSNDASPEILSEWRMQNDRVKIISRKNDGLTSALNLAITESNGKYLARHDADDISSPFRLKLQVALLNKDQNAVLVSSQSVDFLDKNTLIAQYCPPDDSIYLKQVLKKGENPIVHGTILFRKEAFSKLREGYRFKFAQDFDLYLRLSSLGDFRVLPEVLYALRSHSSRIAAHSGESRKRIMRLIMQVNGLISWDKRIKELMERTTDDTVQWQALQAHILKNTPLIPENNSNAQHFMTLIGDNLEKGNRLRALTYAVKSTSACPLWWKTWLSLPYALIGIVLPLNLVSRWRGKGNASRYRRPLSSKITLNQIFMDSMGSKAISEDRPT